MHSSPHVAVVQRLSPTKLMCVMMRGRQRRHISTEVRPPLKAERLVNSVEEERGKTVPYESDGGDALSSQEQRDLLLKHLISNCGYTQTRGMLLLVI